MNYVFISSNFSFFFFGGEKEGIENSLFKSLYFKINNFPKWSLIQTLLYSGYYEKNVRKNV